MTSAGAVVLGRYRLAHEIGSGGAGVVWLATDEKLDLTVALKRVVFAGLGTVAADLVRDRTLREARLAAQLRTAPHVVGLYDVQVADGDVWLVMEYLPSQSLSLLIAERGRLSAGETARIGADIATALHTAHQRGIRHRDVTPGNILIGTHGEVKLTDFGIARGESDPRLTQSGLITGTIAYLAPEIARGDEAGPAADIFSLGAVLYAAVTGDPPFGYPGNPPRLLAAMGNGVPPLPEHARGLEPLLLRTLRQEPGERPDADTVHTGLRELATGLSAGTIEFVRQQTAKPRARPPVSAGALTSETTETVRPAPSSRARHAPALLVGLGVLVALLTLVGTLLYRPSTAGSPVAADTSGTGGTAATNAAGRQAPPEEPRFGQSLRDVDTCALLDEQRLGKFGKVEISRGDYLEGCKALVSTRGEKDATFLGLAFDPPAGERPSFDGSTQRRGALTVIRQNTPVQRDDPECNNYVILADNSVLFVDVYPDTTEQRDYVDLCALADSATETAATRLQRGVPRSDVLLTDYSLSSRRACDLVGESTLATIPNMAYRSRQSGFADWSCYWGADVDRSVNAYLEFHLINRDDLDSYGEPTSVAGKQAYQRQEEGDSFARKCVLRLEHAPPAPQGGLSEVLEIAVDSPQSAAQRCAAARTIARAAERSLSP